MVATIIHLDGRLIAGHRRLGACKLLGHKSVPVRVVDLGDIVRGEAAENFRRKDFTLSEAVEFFALQHNYFR